MNALLDIGAVARASGFPASALRYYEEKGLIQSVGRQGLRRMFPPSVLDRLAFITLGQNAGFSLDEMVSILKEGGAIDRKQLLEKAEALDRTIKQLTAMRDGLRHAAACTASSHFECPTFKRLLRLAVKHKVKSRRRSRRIKASPKP